MNKVVDIVKLPHSCPKCESPEKVANTRDELELLFGTRVMNGKMRREQSWCRDCRRQGLKDAGFDESIVK